MDCGEMILSENYRDLILDNSLREGEQQGIELCSVSVDGLYYLVYVNQKQLPAVSETPYEYLNTPRVYAQMPVRGGSGNNLPDTLSLEAAGILQVQKPPLNLTGRGVIVVLIGEGIDYRRSSFRDEEGNSRILCAWDQTVQVGEPPEGFLYGTEVLQPQFNELLRLETPVGFLQPEILSETEERSGSIMMSLAAGSRSERGDVTGAAPDAALAVVKLKPCKQYLKDYYLLPGNVTAYEETDIMLALQYADRLADRFSRPVVICLGIGTNMGAHSAASPLDRYLARIAVKKNRAVVIAGGDEGNAAHHYSAKLPMGDVRDTFLAGKDVEVRVEENCRGFFLEFWGSVPDIFRVSVRTPGGEEISPPRIRGGRSETFDFIYEPSEVTVTNILIDPATGEELVIFRVKSPTPGIWTFRVNGLGRRNNGTFHMWLPLEQFLTARVTFTEPDPYVTLTEPSMSDNVITVTGYNDANNSFYSESGRGFTRTGRISPDLTAPAINVSTAYGPRTGTSLAAAITAGAVAQFFQWGVTDKNNTYLDSEEIRNYLIRGASRDNNTQYPNRETGYGRLSLSGTFDILASL